MILPVLKFPDARLKQASARVTEVTDEIRQLASSMVETMYDEPGVGLAAPQVGASIRMFVMDCDWAEGLPRNPIVVINPEISEVAGSSKEEEGCLSVPDFRAIVERNVGLTLAGEDLEGNPIGMRAEGLQAICVQHEVDHLDGILYIDRISHLKRSMYIKKRKKQLKLSSRKPKW